MTQNRKKKSKNLVLNDQVVSRYLKQNPNFFIRNASDVERMRVPHSVRDTVSLVEWHMARQRNHIDQLENEISLLVAQATANHQLFDRLLTLQGSLASSLTLQEMLNYLNLWARKLGLNSANIRLFSDKWRISPPFGDTELTLSPQAFEPIRIQRLGKQHHYLGTLNGSERFLLLPQIKTVGSVAMSLIGKQDDLGVLIFSSRDSQHYQSDMGTLLLQYLAAMLPELLSRWIERR